MSDLIIPEHIWTNKQYSAHQKLIIGVVYQHRPEPVLLDEIVAATGLNKQVVSAGAMWAFLKGPNPDIERCYLPNPEKKTFLVAYKYNGGDNEE